MSEIVSFLVSLALSLWNLIPGDKILTLAIYTFAVIAICELSDYFFGYNRVAWIITRSILGLPVFLTYQVLKGLIWLANYPWAYRRRRLFKEYLGFDFPGKISNGDQYSVDKVLKDLADQWYVKSEKLESLRRGRKARRKNLADDIQQLELKIKSSKNEFWTFYRVVQKFGYEMKDSWKDYISTNNLLIPPRTNLSSPQYPRYDRGSIRGGPRREDEDII